MIRKLQKEDIQTCVEICENNFKLLGYHYETEKEFLAQFNDNIREIEFYVYEDNGIIKGVGGLANCWFDDSVYSLCTCYVKPEYQGQGVGKALTEHRINRIKELGGEIIFSTTKQVWHLKRFGFEIIKSPYETWNLMQLICT